MAKKITLHNAPKFLEDLKKVREVMIYADRTKSYFKIRKIELLMEAESKTICYYLTDEIFLRKRNVMVIF